MNKQLRSKYIFVPVETPLRALEKVTCPWSQVNRHPRSEPVTPFLTILALAAVTAHKHGGEELTNIRDQGQKPGGLHA